MKLNRRFSAGREIEIVIRKETVMLRDREVKSFRKLIRRQLDAETATRARHLGTDRRFRERQLLERREKVVVSRNRFSVHEQLGINNRILAFAAVEQLRHPEIEIRATRQRRNEIGRAHV